MSEAVVAGVIPDKLYFKIGEVAAITGLKPHVLRYWEAEFGLEIAKRSPSSQRRYARRDLEQILLIKDLLYAQGFTIAGAKPQLKALIRSANPPQVPPDVLLALRTDLQSLKERIARVLSQA